MIISTNLNRRNFDKKDNIGMISSMFFVIILK